MRLPTADDLLEGIRRWVEIESQTADPEGVNRIMSLCADEFAAAGGRVARVPGKSGAGDHLTVSSPWGGNGPAVLVLCHLDTVHPRGTLAENPFRIEGDRAYGPGIYDMKGGAYLALSAFRALAAAGRTTPLPIRFVYTSDEETGSGTSRELIEAEARNAKYVLVTEPARDGGKVVVARKGVGRYEIRTRGRPAHSGSRHDDGRSAVTELCRQIVAIEGLTDYRRGLTFNIGLMRGGSAANVVPEHAWATIDMRVASAADGEAMDRHLKALTPHDPDVTLEITGGINRLPFEQTPAIRSLFAHAHELAGEIGFELIGTATGGGSDGNFTAHAIPTLDGLGVDGQGAHTLGEHLYISSLEPRMKLLLRLMQTLR